MKFPDFPLTFSDYVGKYFLTVSTTVQVILVGSIAITIYNTVYANTFNLKLTK